MAVAEKNEHVLYQPDESPPPLVSLVHGFHSVVGRMGSMAASMAIIVHASGQTEAYLSWIFFVSLLVCGLGTIGQTIQVWRFGTGYPVTVSNGNSHIPVCISALVGGGPTMLSVLIIVSAMLQFAFISSLSLLRQVITPQVSGAILMLLSATVISILFTKVTILSGGIPETSTIAVAATTVAVIVAFRLFGGGSWGQWGPVIGIISGCAVAGALGVFDAGPFLEASWIGIPFSSRPDFGLSLNIINAEFWAVLPGFVIVHLSTSISSIGGLMMIQQVSWRRPRAVDFRIVQGGLNLAGLTNIVSALLGGLPNAAGRGASGRVALTGVATRRIGLYGGAILIAAAFLPKLIALAVSVPSAVFAAYLFVSLAILFMQGCQMVMRDSPSTPQLVVVGVAFWLGVGFHNQMIFPDYLTGIWATLLGNGLTVGSVILIVLTALMQAAGPRRKRLTVDFNISSLPKINAFLDEVAAQAGWNRESTTRLRAAGEETLSSLLPSDDDSTDGDRQSLTVSARRSKERIDLEFVATSVEANLEDRLAYMSEQPEIQDDRELSFRLLRHYASSVRHLKYHNTDVITVEVEAIPSPQ